MNSKKKMRFIWSSLIALCMTVILLMANMEPLADFMNHVFDAEKEAADILADDEMERKMHEKQSEEEGTELESEEDVLPEAGAEGTGAKEIESEEQAEAELEITEEQTTAGEDAVSPESEGMEALMASMQAAEESVLIDFNKLEETPAGYTVSGNQIILQPGDYDYTYKITGTATGKNIVVDGGKTTIEIEDLKMSKGPASLIRLTNGAEVVLIVSGTNELSNVYEGGGSGAGIEVPVNASITITGTGKLIVTGSASSAGIGGGIAQSSGVITFDGEMDIEAEGGPYAAAIGGGYAGGGTINIHNGTIDAKARTYPNTSHTAYGGGAGIGSGSNAAGATDIYIDGGKITAAGGYNSGVNAGTYGKGNYGGSGIGGGNLASGKTTITIAGNPVIDAAGSRLQAAGIGTALRGAAVQITITGSPQIKATGSIHGPGIGNGSEVNASDSEIKITGGKIEANGGYAASGIGGGNGTHAGKVIIGETDGTEELEINAVGGFLGAGIGDGVGSKIGGTINIHSGKIYARGGNGYNSSVSYGGGAGIGNSWTAVGSNIYIDGGDITAIGGYNNNTRWAVGSTGNYGGAGIGGGSFGSGGTNITIEGSPVIDARGATQAAGIGTGFRKELGTIMISGYPEIKATGGPYGTGIGSGSETTGTNAKIEINSGLIEATGGNHGAGIGGGNGAAVGIILIDGNDAGDELKVKATGGIWAAGIGGGPGKAAGDITLRLAEVTAIGGDYGGAGIGGGYNGGGGNITIDEARVTARAGTDNVRAGNNETGCAIGAGAYQGKAGTKSITITEDSEVFAYIQRPGTVSTNMTGNF